MSDPNLTPRETRAGMLGSVLDIVRGLTIQNVLTLGILCIIAVPAYFAYLFMSDDEFRREFMASSKVVDAQVPCLVIQGNVGGGGDRVVVTTAYALVGRLEHHIATRSPGLMTDTEIKDACDVVHEEARLIKIALRDREAAVEKK